VSEIVTKNNLLLAIKKSPLFIHSCSMCGYECQFMFDGELLGYDSGCYCTGGCGGWSPVSESQLDFYLDPSHGWISKLETFIQENLSGVL